MTRYVIMGIDECGQHFNAGQQYYPNEQSAYAEVDKVREDYPEARSIFVEPLFSDLAYARFGDPDWDEQY